MTHINPNGCEVEPPKGYSCTRDFHHNGPCALIEVEVVDPPAASEQAGAAPKWLDVDWLSNVIRKADGRNALGAGALAEKIVEAIAVEELTATPSPASPAGERERTPMEALIESIAEWIRSNHKDYPTVNAMCSAMSCTFYHRAALATQPLAEQKPVGEHYVPVSLVHLNTKEIASVHHYAEGFAARTKIFDPQPEQVAQDSGPADCPNCDGNRFCTKRACNETDAASARRQEGGKA